jgi:hypothetical protein
MESLAPHEKDALILQVQKDQYIQDVLTGVDPEYIQQQISTHTQEPVLVQLPFDYVNDVCEAPQVLLNDVKPWKAERFIVVPSVFYDDIKNIRAYISGAFLPTIRDIVRELVIFVLKTQRKYGHVSCEIKKIDHIIAVGGTDLITVSVSVHYILSARGLKESERKEESGEIKQCLKTLTSILERLTVYQEPLV